MKYGIGLIGIGLLTLTFQSCGGEEHPVEDFAKSRREKKVEEPKYAAGEAVYKKTCVTCHQADGKGMEGAFPPLAGSDYLLQDKARAIKQVIHGSEGEITVNGMIYTGIMPAQEITDKEVKDVINYILNSWGNDGGEVTMEDVVTQKNAS
ncbi:MAG: cytochrome c [Crocinitomicaceae bacterium]